MNPTFLFHVPFGLSGSSVGLGPNEAQDRYAEVFCLSWFVWRTFVEMSGNGAVIIVVNVKEMTVESSKYFVLCLTHIVDTAMRTCYKVDAIACLTVYVYFLFIYLVVPF